MMPNADAYRMYEFKQEAEPEGDLCISGLRIVWQEDTNPDLSYLDSDFDDLENSCRYSQTDVETYGEQQVREWVEQDRKRLEEYGNTWIETGIWAECTVFVRQGHGWLMLPVRSGGLWGLESDSDAGFIRTEAKQQLRDLAEVLRTLNPVLVQGWLMQAREALDNFEFMEEESHVPEIQ